MTSRIIASFTTRHDGVSEAPYTSCNLGLHVGDDPAHVRENRARVGASLGLPLEAWVAGEQVHEATVTVVTEELKGRGSQDLESMIPATDALITNVPGIGLTTYAADCVPLLFSAPDVTAVGCAHAGWQGTVKKIAAHTVRALISHYGADPARMQVWIGPSIGPCCYEVDERVATQVRSAFPNAVEQLLTPNENGRWQLDLWQANVTALLEAGVLAEHIHREDACTSCRVDTYFSHRKEAGKTGRHAGIVAILQEKEGN
ncbi:peptidoglycan editing factor PgeF [Tumebacillus sp. ITR2]|uniref:Purine nucleoside phosphorylase n=1 Tax=Tumebacillus amylolyticus TaxID=2801339 RepID=A0ABS1JGQ4_9BACL|nr:peptidoglycan editing factor PgeF [Tumebacillus amylolyticus]MBL0389468.1 peptidoglycan editing factor PgeF [Tumebacillus amylolyticus]